MRKAVLHTHRHHFNNRPAADGHGTGFRPETGPVTCRTLLFALVYLKLFAMFIILGFVQPALKRRKHSFERLIYASPGKDKIVIESMHQLLAEGRRKLFVRSGEIHLVLLCDLLEKSVVVHYGVVSGAAPRMDAFSQGKRLVRNDKILIEIVYRPKSTAFRARPERRVERKGTRLQFIE